MLRLVQPCQPGLSNLTLLLYCFLGHQVDHHMALLANHWYLLILLFPFYLFYLYHHHPSLLYLATRPHLPQAGLCGYPVYLLIIHHPKHRLAVLYHPSIVYWSFCQPFSLPFISCHFTHLAYFQTGPLIVHLVHMTRRPWSKSLGREPQFFVSIHSTTILLHFYDFWTWSCCFRYNSWLLHHTPY